tara:strand:- start:17221 stop:18510 length:1290 start_codon:yes stop_codon:yes gene_type:complete
MFRAALVLAAAAGLAHAQATDPHVFIANEGNLEGSVTSMKVNPDGTLTFVDRVITGSRPSTSQPCPGCNPYAIALSPDGRFLATTHASGNFDENIIVYEVSPDGTIAVVETILLPQGGLDIDWVRDGLLAVCVTDLSGPNQIRLYTFDETTMSLSFESSVAAGSFLTSIAVHPNEQWIYGNDSFGFVVRQFEVTGTAIAQVDSTNIPVYGTALKLSPDGRFLYASGGISAGGRAFAGYALDPVTGGMSPMAGNPFTSPGQSPKGFAITPDNEYLYVSHGTDATIRSFRIDQETGVPTTLPHSFDVGTQGTLQGMATLDGLLFALDDSTAIDGIAGAYSFAIDAGTGAFLPLPGSPVPTQGIAPNDVAAWPGAGCPADLTGDGQLNFFDIAAFIALYNAGDPAADLAEPIGTLNFFDIAAYISLYNAGCP